MTVAQHLMVNEKKINSRATVRNCPNRSFLRVLELAYMMSDQKDKVEQIKERIEKRKGNTKI